MDTLPNEFSTNHATTMQLHSSPHTAEPDLS